MDKNTTRIFEGMWLEFIDRANNRNVFSVATSSVTEEEFMALWVQLGKTLYRVAADTLKSDKASYYYNYEIRLTKIGGLG